MTNNKVLLVLVAVLLAIVLVVSDVSAEVFEDGSFVVSGCVSFEICAEEYQPSSLVLTHSIPVKYNEDGFWADSYFCQWDNESARCMEVVIP